MSKAVVSNPFLKRRMRLSLQSDEELVECCSMRMRVMEPLLFKLVILRYCNVNNVVILALVVIRSVGLWRCFINITN
jgi:hypothetical protein